MVSTKAYQQMIDLGCNDSQIPPWVLRPGEKPKVGASSSKVGAPAGAQAGAQAPLLAPPSVHQEQPPIGAGSQENLQEAELRAQAEAPAGAPAGAQQLDLRAGPSGLLEDAYVQLPDGRMLQDRGNGTFKMVTGAGSAEQDRLNQ